MTLPPPLLPSSHLAGQCQGLWFMAAQINAKFFMTSLDRISPRLNASSQGPDKMSRDVHLTF